MDRIELSSRWLFSVPGNIRVIKEVEILDNLLKYDYTPYIPMLIRV